MIKRNFFYFDLIIFATFSCCYLQASNESYITTYDDLFNKAYSYRNIDSDSVLHYSYLAFKLSKEKDDFDQQVKTLIFLTQTKLKLGDLVNALIDIKQALNIINENKLINRKKECLTTMGVVYQTAGYYDEALDYFFQAKKIDRVEDSNFFNIVDLDYYLGSIYVDLDMINEGRNYLKKSASFSLINGDEKGAFKSFMRLSDTYTIIDSINYFMGLAEDILYRNKGLSYEKIVLYNNKAQLYKALGNYSKSKILYTEAIKLGEVNHFQEYLIILYNNYAYLLNALGKVDSAEIMLKTALELSKKNNFLFLKANVFDSYSDLFVEQNNFQNAYLYKDSSDMILKEVEKNKQIKQSLFLSTVFETEKKENEILIQKNKNFNLWVYLLIVILILVLLTIFLLYSRQKLQLNKARVISLEKDKKLDIANALLEGQDAERKRLAMDLHDGLGATLGTLRLAIDGELKDNRRYHEIANLIDEIRQSVREMSHRMMPTRLDKLGLIPSINNLAVSITKTGNFTVDFKTNIKQRLSGNLEINIYYLVYELVNNAIHHSNGNTIFVELIDHEDLISLSVIDNGKGFKSDEFSDGMGLKNVKARIQYMDGTLNVDANGQETIFMVEIPNKQ